VLYLFLHLLTLRGQGVATGDRPPEYDDMSEVRLHRVTLVHVQSVAKARSAFASTGGGGGEDPRDDEVLLIVYR